MTSITQDVSVIICAYTEERWDTTVAAIRSAQQQTPPPLEVILVVDHNPALLERARTYLSDVVTIENAEQRGASGARNSGVAVARGRHVAFLDDDAVADPDWLKHLSDWCDHPRVIGAGGRIDPVWLSQRPAWFPDEFGWVVGYSYTGMPQAAAPIRNIFSGAMCMRRDVFEAIGGFRRGFGKTGTRSEPEDTEICIRAVQEWPEHVWMYEPRARIRHRIPASRSRWRFFIARCYNEGLGKAALVRLVGVGDGLSAERTYTRQTLPRAIRQGVGDALRRGDPAGLARASAIVAGLTLTVAGYLMGKFAGARHALSQSVRRRGLPASSPHHDETVWQKTRPQESQGGECAST